MRIQHNIMAMNAYRNFNRNTSALSKNLEKLSSGYNINRAGDDAAGLAISEKMRARITGLTQAQANAKSGINLVQTAEGAMQEVHDMLNRMVKLADQSANGTYDNEVDRVQLQKEVDQLKDEINRIADASNFNGIKLLDGSLEAKTTVIAPEDVGVTVVNDGQLAGKPQSGVFTIDLSQLVLTSSQTASGTAGDLTFTVGGATFKDGSGSTAADVDLTGALTAGGKLTGSQVAERVDGSYITLDDVVYEVSAEGSKITLTGQKAPASEATTALDVVLSTTNGTSNQGDEFAVTVVKAPVPESGRVYAKAEYTLDNSDVQDGKTLTIGDTTYTFAVGKDSKFAGGANVIDLTDIKADASDIAVTAANRLTAAAQGNKNFIVGTDFTTGKLTFTEKEGGVDYEKNNLAGASAANNTDGDWVGLITKGVADATKSNGGLTLQIGDTSDKFNQLTVSIQDMHADSLGIAGIDISTQEGAAKAVDAIKKAINTVSDVRGTLGATQNRLDHTINNLSVMTENIQDAESTIRDTDVAEEMMAYTKNNILIQSAQAMLAQANQVPQGVLQLLG